MSTKDIVAQEILSHEAIYKIAKLLDQFCDGLKAVQLLGLVRAFPVVFSPLFTYSGDIDGREVAERLFVDKETELTRQNEIIMDFLHKYLAIIIVLWVFMIMNGFQNLRGFFCLPLGKRQCRRYRLIFCRTLMQYQHIHAPV